LIEPSYAWKLVLAVALAGAVLASMRIRAPRRTFPGTDLRRLVFAAITLYASGVAASLTHHEPLAAVAYSGGIAVSALAAWLSRGSDSGGGPPHDEDPPDQQPPPGPDGVPRFDWAAFEREFRAYSRRRTGSPERRPAAVP
jgi:hypothetical protein